MSQDSFFCVSFAWILTTLGMTTAEREKLSTGNVADMVIQENVRNTTTGQVDWKRGYSLFGVAIVLNHNLPSLKYLSGIYFSLENHTRPLLLS